MAHQHRIRLVIEMADGYKWELPAGLLDSVYRSLSNVSGVPVDYILLGLMMGRYFPVSHPVLGNLKLDIAIDDEEQTDA